MLGIGREYRNTRYETTGNVQVVLLSSQHSLAVSSLVVCVCVCVIIFLNLFMKNSVSFLFRHVRTHGVLGCE